MKKTVLRILSIITLLIGVCVIYIGVTVTGGDFLDLSNVVRYFCFGTAFILIITSTVTGYKGWKK